MWRKITEKVNTLVDNVINEADLIPKGSNAVVSYLHFFFENFCDIGTNQFAIQ